MNKYHARKTTIDGITFDSKAESDRYLELKIAQSAGAISDLRVHPVYTLQDAFYHRGKKIQPIRYEADFEYIEIEKVVVEDTKGFQTVEFRIKRKMFLYRYPEYELRIVEV